MIPQSDDISVLAPAFIKMQRELGPAIKKSINPYFKSNYSDLNSVWDACEEILHAHDFGITQGGAVIDGKPYVTTMLMHSSGQFLRSYLPIVGDSLTQQGVGGAVTYNRRYGLSAILSLMSEKDDDAESATDHLKPIKKALDGSVPTDYLDKYVESVAAKKGHTKAQIVQAALNPKLWGDFKSKYIDFIKAQLSIV